MPSKEHHRIFRSNWLRAAVLGANDGIVSTASLITGVAAAQAGQGVNRAHTQIPAQSQQRVII